MDQIPQIVGAVLVLIGFAAAQRGSLSPHSVAYLVLNVAGGAILTVVALVGRDWGFLLLEVVWTIVSLWGLVQVSRTHTPSAAH
jgi:protein-S-isoprenylcysteine O-methyltransferase Ste14